MKLKNMTYCHEHTTIDLSGVKKDLDCRLNCKEDTINEFKALKEKGVSRILDMTNRGMGRDIFYINDVSRKSGIDIIPSTGYYKEPYLPKEVYELNEEALSKILVKELMIGIEETNVKAKIIGEIGTSLDHIEDMEKKVFSAASRAHLDTGAPIVTHTTLGKLGLEQLEIFQSFGVNLRSVVLSHIDLSGDLEYILRLLDKGVNIAFDTVGKINYESDENRAAWLKILCNKGYSKQIVLSMDITRKSHLKANGGIGYEYLIDKFLPRLYDLEINEQHIEDMLVNNIKDIYRI